MQAAQLMLPLQDKSCSVPVEADLAITALAVAAPPALGCSLPALTVPALCGAAVQMPLSGR